MSDKLDIAPPTKPALGPIRSETTRRGRIISALTVGAARAAVQRGEPSIEIRPSLYGILHNSKVTVAGKSELESVIEYTHEELVEVTRKGMFFDVTEYYALRWNEGEQSFAIIRALPR